MQLKKRKLRTISYFQIRNQSQLGLSQRVQWKTGLKLEEFLAAHVFAYLNHSTSRILPARPIHSKGTSTLILYRTIDLKEKEFVAPGCLAFQSQSTSKSLQTLLTSKEILAALALPASGNQSTSRI